MSALNCKKTSAGESGSLFALVDERISHNCEIALERCGFKVIKLPPEQRLPTAVASHTDMLIFRHNYTLIVSHSYAENNSELIESIKNSDSRVKVILSPDSHGGAYPEDAIFNCLTIGNKLFGRTNSISDTVKSYAKNAGLELIHVKQGYPACTTLALPCGLAVTGDVGMARALAREGIEVVTISQSEKIHLPPYQFGFIGGTAGVYGGTVYFLGNLAAHPEGDIIEEEITKRGYNCISLDPSADSLSDLGGIFLFGSAENNTAVTGSNISPSTPKSE